MEICKFDFVDLGNKRVIKQEPVRSPVEVEKDSETQEISREEIPAHDAILVEKLKKEAYEEGYRCGISENSAGGNSELLKKIDANLCALEDSLAHTFSSKKQEVCDLVIAISKKVVGDAISSNTLSQIHDMVSDCLDVLNKNQSLVVYINPENADILREHFEYHESVIVKTDDRIAVGDAKVKWDSGEAERNTDAMWEDIQNILRMH